MIEGAEKIGLASAELMESLEEQYDEEAVTIEEAVIVAILRVPEEGTDDREVTHVRGSHSAPYVQRGVLANGLEVLSLDDG